MATADSTQSLSITTVEMTPDEARETDRLIKRHINTTRYLLLDMRDRKGWKALGYASFKEYGEKELGYQESYIHKLVSAAEISLQIGYSPDCTMVQPAERQLRPLAKVPEDERKAIWGEATRKAQEDGEKLTAKRVQDAVTDYQRRIQALETQIADFTFVASTPPTETITPVIESPLTDADAWQSHQHPLAATRNQLYRLGEYLTREYQATGNPFSHASESEIQQWNDLAHLMRQAAESIESFAVHKRPTLTLIQGGAG